MSNLRPLLMVLAVVCFFLAAIGVCLPRGGNLIAVGLMFWALAITITAP